MWTSICVCGRLKPKANINTMDDVRKQVADRLKQANNILVTVRNNPTLDLLSACIGLALMLDKLDKHATAVFSGEVPSALEFLKPEETIERTPDSLRDFIIALDKSKADKLRYKVEDKVVRIFITPYRTSITQDDLEFSQGDFNVDVIVALGAHEQQELDQAVTAHGRILHDAAIVSINNTPSGNLGSLNWQDISASSISEMVTQLVESLGKDALDEQIATALLTGIVAETERFSNDKTTPKTMSLAGTLMEAGANQQLVANKLQVSGGPAAQTPADVPAAEENGALEILHEAAPAPEAQPAEPAKPQETPAPPPEGREILPMPSPDAAGASVHPLGDESFTKEFADAEVPGQSNSYLVDADTTAKTPDLFDEKPAEPPVLTHGNPTLAPEPQPSSQSAPPMPNEPVQLPTVPPTEPAENGQTLSEIEESVHSPHAAAHAPVDVDKARTDVLSALGPQVETPRAFNANQLGDILHPRDDSTSAPLAETPASPTSAATSPMIKIDDDGNLKHEDHTIPLPPVAPQQQPPAGPGVDPNKKDPPPVPPPFMPSS